MAVTTPLDLLIQAAMRGEVPLRIITGRWDGRRLHPSGAGSAAPLPQKAQDYVRRLEELSGCRISYIGVGPGRDQTIVLHDVMA